MFGDKELIFTAETTPDLSMDLESSVNKIIPLVGLADAVNITDSPNCKTKLSSILVAAEIKKKGLDVILQLTGRDRNRIAIESEIIDLSIEDQLIFLKEMGLHESGLNKLISNCYELLNLETFFTAGKKEVRSWTIKKNTLAPKAASVIHTDFEKNFIRAEAVSCDDFIKFGSAEKCKENGKLRIEGKDYIVKDGDVLFFRVNP